MEIKINARAKINLDLVVNGRDKWHKNLHDITTTMVLLDDFYASLTFNINKSDGFISSFTVKGQESQEWFTPIEKMVHLWSLERRTPVDVNLEIENPIPYCTGLGGMSSYISSALSALEEFYFNEIRTERGIDKIPLFKLMDMALQCGSDVPFFVSGATRAKVTGVGNVITPEESKGRLPVILHIPQYKMSTKDAYKELDDLKLNTFLDLPKNRQYHSYLTKTTENDRWQLSGSGSAFFIYNANADEIKLSGEEWTKKGICAKLYYTAC